jgi:hypothetical protein
MNALVPSSQRHGAERGLADSEARFLMPAPWTTEIFRQVLHRGDVLPACAPSVAAAERAREILAISPAADVLARFVDAASKAAGLDESQETPTRGMIGLLLDAFPHSRPPNLPAYAGSMLHDVVAAGYSPSVVAAACRELRRTLKYPPAISEMLAACEKERETLRYRAAAGMRLLEIAAAAERLANAPVDEKAA